MQARFRKRRYQSFREFFADIWFLLRNGPRILRVLRKGSVSPAFRERLMLAVIAVYGCRYCSWAHTREAFRSGLTSDDVTTLLSGSIEGCPDDEAVAILYAQHWADSDAKPTPESSKMLADSYGAEKAQAVNLVLRMIRVGNLTGNTWDYLLHRVSFGRLGSK
ncbi:MAG: carboxymuconolactone decarboxylase family protein [Dehalococcoidia bacterium]|nr:carboxymuconolactone decarboxylase family protein [Dehalococcoidia bacterium]